MATFPLHRKLRQKDYGILPILLLAVILSSPSVSAQQLYNVVQSGNSLLIKGGSNLHDWETKGQQIAGELTATVENNKIKKIDKVSIKIPVTSIKSGKGTMDSKVYEALKNDKSPPITYQSSTISLPRSNEITSIGQLTVAGVTKDKTFVATYVIGTDGKMTIKGNVKLKMTEFGMTLPTAFFGSLKVYDDVEILYEVSFK
jgi:hypothetical protein